MNEPAVQLPPAPRLPTEDELPCSDGEPLESDRHIQQMNLLIETARRWLESRPDGYAGGNMFLYFSEEHLRRKDFRGPDVYLALAVSKRERKSWVVWQEGKPPDLVIELLSESTAQYDKTTKKAIYQDQLRIPEYYWYDPWSPDDLAGFTLTDGAYRPIPPDARGRLVSPVTGLALARWTGTYRQVSATWLRWETPDGRLVPTDAEAEAQRAEAEAHRADAEAERAEAAEAEVARLRALLAERGD
jgi:Uma2 family endonuclease